MAEVDTIDIPDATPTTRTVATTSKLIKSVGLPADDKSTATDVTPLTHTSILKQISASIQAVAAALAGTLTVASHAVTNAGTFLVQAVQTGTWTVQPGNTANTTPWLAKISDGTNAVAIKAASTAPAATDPAMVVTLSPNSVNANGQATMALSAPVTLPSDSNGPYSSTANFISGAITTAMTGTLSTSLVAAPGASLRNYITSLIVSNSHATVGTDVVIQDGSGGTVLLTIPAAAVYGGAVITLPVPLKQPTTNTALFCANVTIGASTKVSAVGYKGA